MKVSAVLSTLVVAGLVSAAPQGYPPRTTDLQQAHAPQAHADGHLVQRDVDHLKDDRHKDPKDHPKRDADHKEPKKPEPKDPKDHPKRDVDHKEPEKPEPKDPKGPKPAKEN